MHTVFWQVPSGVRKPSSGRACAHLWEWLAGIFAGYGATPNDLLLLYTACVIQTRAVDKGIYSLSLNYHRLTVWSY